LSGLFFWIANAYNLLGMEVLDLISNDFSMLILTVSVIVMLYLVNETYVTATAVK